MKLNYFSFKPFKGKILLTNDFGDFTFVNQDELSEIVAKRINPESETGKRLVAKRIIYDDNDLKYSSENRFDLRATKGFLNAATSLHIFVVTTACNMRCVYCQANNGRTLPHLYMDEQTAEHAVDIALQSPAVGLTFEFQGGEPLLNYPIIKHIVEYAEKNKQGHSIEYNLVSNLTLLNEEMLTFFAEHSFGISTSLDGFEQMHNQNRPYVDGTGTYDTVVKSIERVRKAGIRIGAIETTTKASLQYPEKIVQAYAQLGFDTIFIRPLTPLGKAAVYWNRIGYTPEEFISFYEKAIDEILRINKNGMYLKECHASIFLGRISGLTINYMELRSPCGAAIGQLAYYADGNIFTCDEARMLYEMGDNAFLLGNVHENSYQDLIQSSVCRTVCAASMLETIPSCCDCVYQPYCGTCPVVNYAATQDIIEKYPRNYRCRIYSGMLDCLFSYLEENDTETVRILKSWGE